MWNVSKYGIVVLRLYSHIMLFTYYSDYFLVVLQLYSDIIKILFPFISNIVIFLVSS